MAAPEERVVSFRPRTILIVLGVTLLVFVLMALVYFAFRVITWILIAAFLAAALNPAVEFFERRGVGRGLSSGLVFLLIPPLVDQVREFIDALPGIVADLTAGRGPLGFLERDYQVVERVQEAIDKAGTGGVTGLTGPAVEILTRILTGLVGALTIAFLTFFMLLEGPRTVDHFLGLLPE